GEPPTRMPALVRAGLDAPLASPARRPARAVYEALRGGHGRHAARRGGGAVLARAQPHERGGGRRGGAGAHRPAAPWAEGAAGRAPAARGAGGDWRNRGWGGVSAGAR